MIDVFAEMEDSSVVTKRIEYRFRRADGSWAWLESTGSHRQDTSITGYVLNSRDITARKQSTQQALVLNRVLRHNLRNRLTIIIGAATLLKESDSPTEHPLIDRILRSASHLEDLSSYTVVLNDILETHQLRPQQIEVTSLLGRICTRLSEEFPPAEFEFHLPDEQFVRGVSNLNLALTHVLENALEHNDTATPHIRVSVRSPDSDESEVQITIADNGPGIPEQEQEVLLEGKETQLKHGSGLGLWIVNWIVTHSGGRIIFDENEPRGSRVTLCLPPGQEE